MPEAELPPIREPLDPGIAAAVELLRAEGLATTDSGDGYSKVEAIEAGEANNHGHVFIEVCGGMSAEDIIDAARTIPWTDYGYRVPEVELLSRDGQCIHAGSDPDVVAVLWLPGALVVQNRPNGPETAPDMAGQPTTSGEGS